MGSPVGRTKLRTFNDAESHFWLEQNTAKRSRWAKLAREGCDIAWEFDKKDGGYSGRMLIDGEIYTPSAANEKVPSGLTEVEVSRLFLFPRPWCRSLNFGRASDRGRSRNTDVITRFSQLVPMEPARYANWCRL